MSNEGRRVFILVGRIESERNPIARDLSENPTESLRGVPPSFCGTTKFRSLNPASRRDPRRRDRTELHICSLRMQFTFWIPA
jgi:hypothetical protein